MNDLPCTSLRGRVTAHAGLSVPSLEHKLGELERLVEAEKSARTAASFDCPVCYEVHTCKTEDMLRCSNGHGVCHDCSQQILHTHLNDRNSNYIACPMCREKYTSRQLAFAYSDTDFSGLVESQPTFTATASPRPPPPVRPGRGALLMDLRRQRPQTLSERRIEAQAAATDASRRAGMHRTVVSQVILTLTYP